jgi:hypothetical protein
MDLKVFARLLFVLGNGEKPLGRSPEFLGSLQKPLRGSQKLLGDLQKYI